MNEPNVGNLKNCVEELRAASCQHEEEDRDDKGPPDPTDYAALVVGLGRGRVSLPPLYRRGFVDPLCDELERLGEEGFALVMKRGGDEAMLMSDLAHAVLQNHSEKRGEEHDIATDAFQEVVSDLYDGFLSAEDRRGVEPPDSVVPPLVKWGRPDDGPYTWPIDAARSFGVNTGVVSLPPAYKRSGLLAWAALGHETAGHDILRADRGLQAQLAGAVRTALEKGSPHLADYWADRIDETASDVMGILNMGPAAGIGLLGYFRGLNAAADPKKKARLWNDDHGGEHPADILRGYLAAATVGGLAFSKAGAWAALIEKETDTDAAAAGGVVVLDGRETPVADAKISARAVAHAIMNTPTEALGRHALAAIQNWRDSDEAIVATLRTALVESGNTTRKIARGEYAAHAVAAAITNALQPEVGNDVQSVLPALIKMLKDMHDQNPSWGPLYVTHPGDLVRHVAHARRSAPAHASPRVEPAWPPETATLPVPTTVFPQPTWAGGERRLGVQRRRGGERRLVTSGNPIGTNSAQPPWPP